MEQYTKPAHTPLKFHRFFWHMWIPFLVISTSVSLVGILGNAAETEKTYLIMDAAYSLATVFLFVKVFMGFRGWKKSALKALYSQFALSIVYSVTSAIIYLVDMPELAMVGFAGIIGTLLRCVPIGIYYYKRRLLFNDVGFDLCDYSSEPSQQIIYSSTLNAKQQRENGQHTAPQQYTPYPQQAAAAEDTKQCPHCGRSCSAKANFCSGCGQKFQD